jgi:hypothetical protein
VAAPFKPFEGGMSTRLLRLTRAITFVCLVAIGARSAWADTTVSDFSTGFDGWNSQWHKTSPSGTDGLVTFSSAHGYLDTASLKFDMGDGHGDDGTL